MKKLIDNKFTNLYLNAAEKLGLNYEVIHKKTAFVKIYNGLDEILIIGNVMDLNKELNARIAANKKKTSTLLDEEKIPVPRFASFKRKGFKAAVKFAMEKIANNNPIVIKPLSGEGAFGITINPVSEKEITEAVTEAFAVNVEIMIEEFIEGDHFRVTVFDDEIIAITQRVPGYVTGDGERTLTELINQKNARRAQKNLPPIKIRKKDHNYIQSRNIDLSHICRKGERIELQHGCDLEIGGERLRILKKDVPEVNKKMFKRAAKTIGLRLSGIDYITPSITTPYMKLKSAINEINSCPSFDVHYLDTYPNNNYAAERVLEKYFFGNTQIVEEIQISTSANIFESTISSTILSSPKNSDLN